MQTLAKHYQSCGDSLNSTDRLSLSVAAQMKKTPHRRGLCTLANQSYAFSLRRIAPAKPTSPVPSRVKEPGSGTTMLVSPLEMLVLPLK
jgi:hypothetical protein